MKKFKKPYTLNDCVYLCMRNGKWWTFWNLQQVISAKTGKFFGEPTISAAIRNLRKQDCINDYDLQNTEIEKRKLRNSRGYEYRIAFPDHSRSHFDSQNVQKMPNIQQNSKGEIFYE